MARRTNAVEGLDDEHPATAAGARLGECIRDRLVVASFLGFLVCGHGEQFAHPGEVFCAASVCEQAVTADALEAFGQDVEKEPAVELARRQRHGRVPPGPLDPVVLDLEDPAFPNTVPWSLFSSDEF